MNNFRVAVLVLSFNAQTTILDVLSRIPKKVKQSCGILVFDDNSQDQTVKIVQEEYEGVLVFQNKKNLGYGGNQKKAYNYCIEKKYDVVVMLHGDGQYPPELLENIFGPILEGRAEMVFGSRMKLNPLKGNMPLYKFFGNKILTSIQNLIVGSNFSEYHSGYRAYKVESLKEIPLDKLTFGFSFDTQILILFHQKKKRILEIPIPTFYGNEISYVKALPYGLSCIKETVSYKLNWGIYNEN